MWTLIPSHSWGMEEVTRKNKRTTLERADKFISPIYFKDVNLRGRYIYVLLMMMILTSTYIDYMYIISYSPIKILQMWSLDLCSSWVIIIEVAIPNVNFYWTNILRTIYQCSVFQLYLKKFRSGVLYVLHVCVIKDE